MSNVWPVWSTGALTPAFARPAANATLYFQLWRRDSNDVKFAQDWIDAWQKYGRVPLGELKARMIKDGVYVEKSDYVPQAVPPTAGPFPSAKTGIDRPDGRK